MSGTGRSLSRKSFRVPWEDAKTLAGGERALTHRGDEKKAPAVVSRYQNYGVPIQEIGEQMYRAWKLALDSLQTDRSHFIGEGAGEDMPHEYTVASEDLWRLGLRAKHDDNARALLKNISEQIGLFLRATGGESGPSAAAHD